MLLLPLLPGLAQGALSGIFGASSRNAEIDAANQLAIAQYKQAQADRLARYMGEINVYNTNKLQYKMSDRAKTEALYAGLGENQQWINDIRKNLGVQSVNKLTELLQGQGELAASNAAPGASTARLSRMQASQYGQQQAMAQESLSSAYNAAKTKNQQLLGIYRRERMNSWLPLNVRPDPGFEPAKPILQGKQNVFTAGLLGGLQGAASSALGILSDKGLSGLGIGGRSSLSSIPTLSGYSGNSSYFNSSLNIPGINYSGLR